jgi:hypothetical protein
MKKQSKVISGICCMVVFFFISGVIMPACNVQICAVRPNETEPFKKSSQEKASQSNYDDNESFFNFAIIWGTFEVRYFGFPFLEFAVYNPGPWYNRTIYVLGYQNWVPQWVFKKAYNVDGTFHIGIIGFHRLAIVAYGIVDAF